MTALGCVAAAAVALAAAPAFADVLAFDESNIGDTSTGGDPPLPADYHGFTNSNIFVLDPTKFGSWDPDAAVSSPNIAANGGGGPASLYRGDSFNFVSGYFANGITDSVFQPGTPPVTVTIRGRDVVGGAVTHSISFGVAQSPALQTFNWNGVQELDFSSAGRGGGLSHFSMDNLTVTFGAVEPDGAPEPATWAIMLTGFFGAGAVLRRRRSVAA